MLASGASSQGKSQLLPCLTSANSSRMTLGACLAPAAVRMLAHCAVSVAHEDTLGRAKQEGHVEDLGSKAFVHPPI